MREGEGRADGITPPRSAPDPSAFQAAFDSLVQSIRRARGTSGRDIPAGLSFSQYALVRALADREAVRVSDLARDGEVSPSTATRILDALERRALVVRRRTPVDRRTVTVSLTAAGRDALARQDAWMRGRQSAFFAGLPDAQRSGTPALLVGLAGLIDELAVGPSATDSPDSSQPASARDAASEPS